MNCASYDFTCEGSTPYKYFKWEITGIKNKDYIQVGEFELKLNTGYQVYAEFDEGTGTLTFKYGPSTSKPEGAYKLNVGPYRPGWHAQKEKIKTVVFDASFAIARPTTCNTWFSGCKNLTDIKGIENLNTEKVTSMIYMFDGCTKLESLDLTNFNTAVVKSMTYMFNNCSTLTSLNLSNFNNAKVTDMSSMFEGCTKLASLDLSNFNTEKVMYMSNMFYNCSALTSLDLRKFNTAKVTEMNNMFYNCSALTTIYASDKFVTDLVTSSVDMFNGCKNLIGAIGYDETNTNNKDYANLVDGYFTPEGGFQAYAEFDEGTGTLTFRRGVSMPTGAYELNEGRSNPKWYDKREKINKVVFDASFASARPTSCYYWFTGCSNLTTIEGIEYLNTEKVTDMICMFFHCSSLTSLDLSNFNTAKVTDMNSMFYGCNALTSLNLTSFNTAEVTNMSNMFRLCLALTSLDLTNFNTAKVEDMSYMFKSCSALTSLDLSSFNTANVTNMTQMFYNSPALTTIYASDKFVTGQVTKSINMFQGCNELIKYAGNNTNDKDYANYKTGYFTKLVGKNGNDKIGATGEVLTAESLALDDEKDFVAYEPFAAKTASYSRTMKTGTTWGTLCLPFEVSLENQNFRAFNLLSADEGTNTIELEEITTNIAAGTPVIIKMTNGATDLNFSVENKDITKDAQTTATADNNYQLQGLYAKKIFAKGQDDNCYIVKGNKLRNPSKLLENTKVQEVNCKAFRAYMVDNNSSKPAGAKMFSIGFDETATAIDNLNTNADDKAIYYDLQGHRLNGPQKGINIVKRGNKTMKVIIK